MKFRYLPDDDAVPGFPWNITALSQRDVQITIPVPFVTAPGVALSAACFPDGQYDDYYAAKCISNLLALGFRRFYVDLYWDPGRHIWSFCPAQLPSSSEKKTTARHATPVSSTAHITSPAATQPVRRQADRFGSESTSLQTSTYSSISVSRVTLPVEFSTASDTTIASIPTASPSPGVDETLYSLGPYSCTTTSAIDILNDVLLEFLEVTDTTLAAALKYVILNLHAAASPLDPTAPAPQPDNSTLPTPSEHLGGHFKAKYDQYLFTPRILRAERNDLQDSWLEARVDYRPQPAYYTRIYEQGTIRTPNGWPSESVMEFQRNYHHRLLVGFGSIDPQMQGYNITLDLPFIFAPGVLNPPTSNCIYDYTEPSLSATNNSWATSDIPSSVLDQLSSATNPKRLPAITNLVQCGLSPILNRTLSSGTAATDVKPYRQVAFSAIWSWAPGEPRFQSDSDSYRCAVLDPSVGGRWRVQDCTNTRRAACRIAGHPFKWAISPSAHKYTRVPGHCPGNSSFDVPRTALENRFLFETYRRSHGADGNIAALPPIWIDLNSMDAATCWVSGVTAKCPYEARANNNAQIYVPTIAGVVILIVAALLVLVKCGANRRKSRRRRRGSGGWDYEGVPS